MNTPRISSARTRAALVTALVLLGGAAVLLWLLSSGTKPNPQPPHHPPVPAAAPANDAFAAAAALDDRAVAGSTVRATVEPAEAQAGVATNTEHDVWYTWHAAAGTYDILVTGATTPDVRLWTGDAIGRLQPVTAQAAPGATVVTVAAATDYRVQVVTAGRLGAFDIGVELVDGTTGTGQQSNASVPDNDDAAAAIDLTSAVTATEPAFPRTLVTGRTTGAGVEPGEPRLAGTRPTRSVWYSAELPQTAAGHRLVLRATTASGRTIRGLRLAVEQAGRLGGRTGSRVLATGRGRVAARAPHGPVRLLITVEGAPRTFVLRGGIAGLPQPDTTPPVVHCGLPSAGWVSNGTVSCTAADPGGALAHPADAAFRLRVPVAKGTAGADLSTPSRQVCDSAGNCTQAGPVSGLDVDRSAPTVTCAEPPASWVTGQARVTCTAQDTGSGLADAHDAVFALHTSAPAGATRARARLTRHAPVCDLIGHCTDVPVLHAQVDSAPPTVTCTQPASGWQDKQIAVDCAASDSGSGLAVLADAQFQLTTSVAPGASDAHASTDTRKVCDTVGNCTIAGPNRSLAVDLSAPVLHCSRSATGWIAASTAQVSCTASDTGSGLRHAASVVLNASIKPGTQRVAQTGTAQVCDQAGNCATAGPFGVQLDDAAPAVHCGQVPSTWQRGSLQVQCTALDTGSGLAPKQTSAFTLRTAVASGTTNADTVLPRRTICDAVGNCTSTPALAAGRIDRQSPRAICNPAPSGVVHTEIAIVCRVSDAGAGLADPSQSSIVLRTTVATGADVGHAATNDIDVCDKIGNCAQVGPVYAAVDLRHPAKPVTPSFRTPARITVLDANADDNPVPVGYPLPAASDGADVICARPPGALFPLGATTVGCSATTVQGASAQEVLSVLVRHSTDLAPVGTTRPGAPWRAAGTGFAPHSTVTVSLDGQPIGAATAAADGVVVAQLQLPGDLATGHHPVALSGTAADGTGRVVITSASVDRSAPAALPRFSGTLAHLLNHRAASAVHPIATPAAPLVRGGGAVFGGGKPLAHPVGRPLAQPRRDAAPASFWLFDLLLLGAVILAAALLMLQSRRSRKVRA